MVLQQLQASREHEPRPNTFLNSLFAQSTLLSFMDTASFFTTRSLQYAPPSAASDKLDTAVQDTFHAIFSFFEDRLEKEMDSWTAAEGQPSLFFYLAAIYVQPLIALLRQNMEFSALYLIVSKYKRRTIDMGITDPAIEDRLISDPNAKQYFFVRDTPFSSDWWGEFDPPSPVSSSTSYGRNSPSIVMYYPFSTSENNLPQN